MCSQLFLFFCIIILTSLYNAYIGLTEPCIRSLTCSMGVTSRQHSLSPSVLKLFHQIGDEGYTNGLLTREAVKAEDSKVKCSRSQIRELGVKSDSSLNSGFDVFLVIFTATNQNKTYIRTTICYLQSCSQPRQLFYCKNLTAVDAQQKHYFRSKNTVFKHIPAVCTFV
jgi:hypothetical protein